MKSTSMRFAVAGLVVASLALLSAETTLAQCSTCATPTVAYQPVVAQTTVAYQPYNGWYPGKMFDNMRLRRYSRRYGATAAQTYATGYAPYTVGYAPQSVGAPQTVGYRPYVTAYAPLAATTVARPVVQTSYYVPAVSSCSSCVQTVARPVLLSPACSTCQTGCACSSCSTCSSCSSGVSQASYAQPACSSCAANPATPSYPTPADTGQPTLRTDERVPREAGYPAGVPDPAPAEEKTEADPYGLDEDTPVDEAAPEDTNTSFEAPRLLDPRDRTAQRSVSGRVSVDVANAVYSHAAGKAVTQTSYKPAVKKNADGWSSVPRSR